MMIRHLLSVGIVLLLTECTAPVIPANAQAPMEASGSIEARERAITVIAAAYEANTKDCVADYPGKANKIKLVQCLNIIEWEANKAANEIYPESYDKDLFDLYDAETVDAAVKYVHGKISHDELISLENLARAKRNAQQRQRILDRRQAQEQRSSLPMTCVETQGIISCR